MEAATVDQPDAPEQEAPAEKGAEATRTSAHLFQYSDFVHVGTGAEECLHREDGKCQDPEHFHAWVTMPNSLQNRDIEEKAKAAKARRKRALRDEATDAYVTLEAQLDDLLADDRENLIATIAEREVRKQLAALVDEVREDDRFEHYGQDAEEYQRLAELAEDERPAEEWEALDKQMTEFGNAVEQKIEGVRQREKEVLGKLSEPELRTILRDWQIESESQEQYINTYYTWVAFIATRKPPASSNSKRYFDSLADFRNAAPEAITGIEDLVRELESRLIRGDAAGN